MEARITWTVRKHLPLIGGFDSMEVGEIKSLLLDRLCCGLCVCDNRGVYGHMIYRLHATHYEIVHLVVHHNYRHFGVGSSLVRHLINKLHISGRQSVRVLVREDNLTAILFLKSLGFLGLQSGEDIEFEFNVHDL